MTAAIFRVFPALIALLLALALGGCATTPVLPPEEPAMHSEKEIEDEYVKHTDSDPWVGYNKSIYRFNYNFDQYVFLPVVNSYEFIAPTFVQTGVSNFFNNLGQPVSALNALPRDTPCQVFVDPYGGHFTLDAADFYKGGGLLEVPRWQGTAADNKLVR